MMIPGMQLVALGMRPPALLALMTQRSHQPAAATSGQPGGMAWTYDPPLLPAFLALRP